MIHCSDLVKYKEIVDELYSKKFEKLTEYFPKN